MATAANYSALSETDHEINVKELENLGWSKCSIYKVPCNLRKVKEEAYTPQLISIGPIHYGTKDHLLPMQEQKEKYLIFFTERVSNKDFKKYKGYIEKRKEEIRNCYAEKFPNISNDKLFVEMILLDSVFIMEHILRTRDWKLEYKKNILRIQEWKSGYKSGNKEDEMNSALFRSTHKDDYVLTQSWLSNSIHRDLLLLENQIPMFVLNKLYKIVFRGDDKKPHDSFLDLAFEYFAIYDKASSDESHKTKQNLKEPKLFTVLEDKKSLDKLKKLKEESVEPKHFTDLIRYLYLPINLINSCSPKHHPASAIRTVTKLQEAGVSFEKVQESYLLDIKFKKKRILSWFLCLGCIPCFTYCKARVVIPQLKVDHATECVFRNLIAFEQCHYPLEPYICNYVSVLDSLIHTKDDVELLVEKEVIVHELGSDKEVATLVNGLCKHVVAHTSCYHEVIDDINNHYQNNWHHYMAALRLVYFRDPWRASSTLVGIAVLVFTIFSFSRVVRVLF